MSQLEERLRGNTDDLRCYFPTQTYARESKQTQYVEAVLLFFSLSSKNGIYAKKKGSVSLKLIHFLFWHGNIYHDL
jgi:hypothetical protein